MFLSYFIRAGAGLPCPYNGLIPSCETMGDNGRHTEVITGRISFLTKLARMTGFNSDMLADVDVEMISLNGANIEKGKAIEIGVRTGNWIYTATAPVVV